MAKYPEQAKTRISTLLSVVFFTVLSLTVQSAKAQPEDYIIVYKSHSQKQNMVRSQTFTASRSFNIIPAVAARLDANQIKQLRDNPDIAYIEPDYKIHALGRVDTTAGSSSNIEAQSSSQTIPYGITMVNAPAVWPRTKGAGVRVAVMDTGISMYHPDRGNVVSSVSFVPNETAEDFEGHGTHTSGTIAAADNDIGVVGVAPEANLLIAKVMDNSGNGQVSWLISGIEWAVNNNAKVISMSLGSDSNSAALKTACNNAFAAGTLLVASAGNDNTSTPSYPAAFSSVISVMAVDQNKNKASFSNYGSTIAIAAPGVNVYSTVAPIDANNTTGATANVVWSSASHDANVLIGTATGTVSGTICNCGLATGNDLQNTCPNSVAGNIAHIRRGTITFAQKVAHALSKGAIGVIISNNVDGNFKGTLSDGSPLVVAAISQSDGDQLQVLAESGIITGTVSVNATLYAYYSGTSMSCPHVAGVAALVFAIEGNNATPAKVRDILFNSAEDLGQPGRDNTFGYGLVDASAAMNLARMNLLATFVNYWLQDCSPSDWCEGMDSNHSGSVDFIDFAALAQNW
jgi:subtilisin family serine protease